MKILIYPFGMIVLKKIKVFVIIPTMFYCAKPQSLGFMFLNGYIVFSRILKRKEARYD